MTTTNQDQSLPRPTQTSHNLARTHPALDRDHLPRPNGKPRPEPRKEESGLDRADPLTLPTNSDPHIKFTYNSIQPL